jgi:hypothetical protein
MEEEPSPDRKGLHRVSESKEIPAQYAVDSHPVAVPFLHIRPCCTPLVLTCYAVEISRIETGVALWKRALGPHTGPGQGSVIEFYFMCATNSVRARVCTPHILDTPSVTFSGEARVCLQ